jgi:mono/diheme cytochrome c family protein
MNKSCVTLIALWLASSASAQSPPTPGDAAQGRKLYHAHGCYGCHGFNGETGARDLVATNSPFIASEAVFNAFLRMRADQAPLLPTTRMPNYPVEALSNKDVSDIYAFVRSFKLDAPEPATVPTLRAILKSAEKPYRP